MGTIKPPAGVWKRVRYSAMYERTADVAFSDWAASTAAARTVPVKRFRAAINKLYGGRAERVVLFGSRARGVTREGSDYEVAIFIKHPGTLGDELHRLATLSTDILLDTGAV